MWLIFQHHQKIYIERINLFDYILSGYQLYFREITSMNYNKMNWLPKRRSKVVKKRAPKVFSKFLFKYPPLWSSASSAPPCSRCLEVWSVQGYCEHVVFQPVQLLSMLNGKPGSRQVMRQQSWWMYMIQGYIAQLDEGAAKFLQAGIATKNTITGN